MRIYVDSSALLKRVFVESESSTLVSTLRDFVRVDAVLVSSSLAWVEVSRAARTYAANVEVPVDVTVDVDGLVEVCMSGLLEKPITAEVVALARRLAPPILRSLDAIHLSSALLLDVDTIVTYDQRLAAAAAEHRIRTLSPAT